MKFPGQRLERIEYCIEGKSYYHDDDNTETPRPTEMRGAPSRPPSKIRDTRVIRDTHVNTYLAGTDDCQTGTGPGKPGPVPVFRQSNGPGPGPVLATDSVVPDR